MNQLLEYALKYAELGWQVLPIVPKQKVPLTAHGVKDATDHPDTIRAWWEHWPDANIAVACGRASGVYVVDVDVSAAGDVNGLESLKEFPELQHTVQQRTPRNGFHAFFRADNPPANRNSFRPGIDIRGDGYYVVVAPSIHPNGGAYLWNIGCSPWECKPAEYPNFMRPTTKAPWSKEAIAFKGIPIQWTPSSGRPDLLKRASLYLAQVDPAIQGRGGHDKLLWAASALVHGFLLSNEQAGQLLEKEYNPRCLPPWDLSDSKDRKDFVRKIAEARKLTPLNPLGWLLNDDAYAPIQNLISGKDVAKLIENSEKKAWQESQKLRTEAIAKWGTDDDPLNKPAGIPFFLTAKASPSLNKELEFLSHPPGLLGEICNWINITAMREQPFLTLACALTFCGVLFGRKVRDSLESRTNLYCIGIAKSSAGKNHAPNQIRKICQKVGCTGLLGGVNTTGDASMESRLEKSPACLFFWDEIGFLLSYAKSGASKSHIGLIPFLMQLYSSASSVFLGREYVDSEKQRTIIQPCCCIYGTSTPEQFTPGISPEQLQDGWLARCLIFRTYTKPNKKRGNCDAMAPQSILDQVEAWHGRQIGETDGHNIGTFASYHGATGTTTATPPEQIVVARDPKAEEVFIAFDKESTSFGEASPPLDCLWSKSEENARKIALILAASESFDSPCITVPMADYACRLIRYLLLDFGKEIVPIIASNQIDEQKQKLLAIIKTYSIKGCSNRNLVQQARWSTKRQRIPLLEDLIEAGEIVVHIKKGKKVASFWTAKHFQQYLKQQGKQK